MQVFFKFLLFLGLYHIGSQALAAGNLIEEIRCTGGSCLTGGFEKYDSNGSIIEVATCINNDCNAFGWNIFRLNQFNTSVQCIQSSCWGVGFNEINPNDNTLVSIRTCNNGDCIGFGWVDQTFQPAESLANYICDAGGTCDSGFIIQEIEQRMAENEELIARLEKKISHIETQIVRIKEKIEKHNRHHKCRQEKRHHRHSRHHKHKCHNHKHRYLAKKLEKLELKLTRLNEELAQLKTDIVVSSRSAVCLAPNACFSAGYQIFD
ncbi:MAG: hypothetical protein KDD34_09435 [Bdellovibrionales bacterium]|nr:hypothetical protein [Bdellovibrionales bacterium]